MRRLLARIAVLAAIASPLSGCIQSSGPIMTDSAQAFGPTLRLQLYGLSKGFARDPETVTFKWNGHLYLRSGGGLREVSAFSAHAFDGGDFLIQTVPTKPSNPTEFAVARKLVDGVWQLMVVDEADADEATRVAFCKKSGKTACMIETREQLFAFARATAAQRKGDGGLAIRLPDGAATKRR